MNIGIDKDDNESKFSLGYFYFSSERKVITHKIYISYELVKPTTQFFIIGILNIIFVYIRISVKSCVFCSITAKENDLTIMFELFL